TLTLNAHVDCARASVNLSPPLAHPLPQGERESAFAARAQSTESVTYTSLTFFSGKLRTGLPVAAWMALSTAGAATQMVGSPTPPQKSLVVTMTVSTLGNSTSRMIS